MKHQKNSEAVGRLLSALVHGDVYPHRHRGYFFSEADWEERKRYLDRKQKRARQAADIEAWLKAGFPRLQDWRRMKKETPTQKKRRLKRKQLLIEHRVEMEEQLVTILRQPPPYLTHMPDVDRVREEIARHQREEAVLQVAYDEIKRLRIQLATIQNQIRALNYPAPRIVFFEEEDICMLRKR